MMEIPGIRRFSAIPYGSKLAVVMITTSLTLLMLASVAFVIYERDAARNELRHDAWALSNIVGESVAASMLFGDATAASATLRALQTDEHVLCAVLYDAEGRVFTEYHHHDAKRRFEHGESAVPVEKPGDRYEAGTLLTFHAVNLDGERVGTVLLRSSLSRVEERLRSLVLMIVLTLVLALLAAVVVSAWVQKILSRPILSLVATARAVSQNRDYSLRAPEGGQDELGTLSRAFNGMLEQIEERDRSLGEARAELEGRLSELEDQIRQTKEAQAALAKSEEQLRQAQKMEAIGILAGGVAHDFNNILTAIMGYSQLLTRRLGPDSPHKDTVKEILNAGSRAAALTSQLLAFSRRQILEPKVLDLNDVVRNMEKMLRRLIGEDVDFLTVLEPELDRVKVDPGQIEQILLNLAVNSRDAMPDGGTLIIETKNAELDKFYADDHLEVTPGPYVMVSVSDNGCGMEEEMRSRIFEPFFTTKGAGKGTGLGLSTVFGIIKQSGGHVSVYSEPGQGTTFKIYLPKVEVAKTATRPGQDHDPLPVHDERILLVEDQDQVRDVVAQMLESYGYEVLSAACGEAGLQKSTAEKGPIHLLLTDLVMPGMSGRELSEHLAVLRPHTRCLFMSGYTDDAVVRNKVLESGIPFIHKPFTADALHRAVRKVLDDHRAAA
jgi:signal transduction histidine kinase/ActR/RegA family two-component response regulator